MVKKPNAKKGILNVGWTLGSTTCTRKKKTTNIMTLGDVKRTTMLSKGPSVLDTFLGSTINTGKKE